MKEYSEDEVKYIQSSLVDCNLNIQEVSDSMRLINTFKHFIQGEYLMDMFTKIKDKPSNQRHDLVYTFLDRISKIIEQLMQVLQDEQITADRRYILSPSITPELKDENNQRTTAVATLVSDVNSLASTASQASVNYGSVIKKMSSLSQQLMSLISI